MTTDPSTPISSRQDWPNDFGNWGRWDNDRGTLNLITPAKVLEATRSVRSGEVFACGAPLSPEYYPEELRRTQNFDAQGFRHEMLSAYEFAPKKWAAGDKFTLSVHSLENTHIDALSHVGHVGKGFDGVDFHDMVTKEEKAKRFDVTDLGGIVTRAWLVDVPKIRGVEFLQPGDSVTAADLAAGAPDAAPGDAVLVRTGRWLAPVVRPGDPGSSGDMHGDWAAMNINAFSFVAERDLAILGTDSVGDTFPLPYPDSPTVHIVAEVYLGMPLLHSLRLEDVARACEARGSNAFMLAVAPLQIEGATGSPVTPLCVL